MKCYFLTIALVLQGIFRNGGWIEINLQNKEEDKVMFCIPNRYYESPTDTHGHGTMIGYDLVGSETHIVYTRTYNAELEIENWTDNQKIITDSKIVRKGIREGMYWRSDAFLKESGEIVFTLYGYGKDSLEINHILDSAHITNVVGAQLWEYSVETAKKDLAEGNADLILYSGISPSVYLYGDIGFIVDGVFWWLENTSRERFDSSEALDYFLKANPFINKEDIDDVVQIKREEWSAHNIYPNHPKDTFIITTKKDSAIKTFFLNGKPKKRHRGIELGCLLDNAVLKRQIKKQWGINPKRITDITVEGKDIHISTK